MVDSVSPHDEPQLRSERSFRRLMTPDRADRTASSAAARLMLLLGLLALGSPAASASTLVRRLEVMGTHLEVEVVAATRDASMAASELAVRAVSDVEARLSTWRLDSELARVNRAPVGSWTIVSPPLAADLAEAVHWWRNTEGAFHPGLASLVSVWDLRGGGRVPAEQELAAAQAGSAMANVELDGRRVRRLQPGFGIDEGGFGKGVALREAAAAALAAGAICVALDLGGQLHLAGRCAPREVAIADPDARHRAAATLVLTSGSAASSGNSERAVVVDGQRVGHLLDPRTGRPAADFGSVTVVAEDPVAADCVATALFVLGPEAGLAWADARSDIDAVFVLRSESGARMAVTEGLSGAVTPAAEVTVIERVRPSGSRHRGRTLRQGGTS